MPTTPGNALDITQAGLVRFDGVTTFTGVTVTNHATLVGAASNGITSIGPGASLTVFQGNTGADPTFNLSIGLNNANAGLTQGLITWVDGTRIHNFGSDNIFFGQGAGNGTLTVVSATDNIGIGLNVLTALTTGSLNAGWGANTLAALQTGGSNTAIGVNSMRVAVGNSQNVGLGVFTLKAATSGNNNTAVGYNSLVNLVSGASNSTLGQGTGTAYTGAETNNILIGSGVTGTLGESNTIRIGSGTTSCFITGIDGVNVGSVSKIVTEASNQLGTATLTAGTGITITPTANTITIASTGTPPSSNVLTQFDFVDDFPYVAAAFSTSGNLGPWWAQISGTGAQLAPQQAGIQTPCPGDVTLFTGTTTTGSVVFGLIGGLPPITFNDLLLGFGTITTQWIAGVSLLSSLAQRYILRIGLANNNTSPPASGCWFEYSDNVNSGNWTINCSNSSVLTQANTTTAAVSGSNHNYKIIANAGATSVAFFIDGVQVTNSPITTNIPATSQTLAPFISITKTTGTNSFSVVADLCTVNWVFTTPRPG